MPTLIERPTRITAAGNKPKLIDEYVGRVNSGEAGVSVAHMRSPAGWVEPGQTPEFDEYTLVLSGLLRVEHRGGALEVRAGQAVVVRRGAALRLELAENRRFCVTVDDAETAAKLLSGLLQREGRLGAMAPLAP